MSDTAKRLLRLAVSAAILGGLAVKTDWAQVSTAVRGLRWQYAFAAFAVLIAAQVVSAVRWQWLARPLGFGGPLRAYVGAYFVGMFFNLLLPTSVGGDAVRAIYLNAGSGRKVAAVLSVLLDRMSGLLVLLGVACTAALVCPVPLPMWVRLAVGGAAVAAVVGLIIAPWIAARAARLGAMPTALSGHEGTESVEHAHSKQWAWHTSRTAVRIGRLAASTRDAMSVYRREPRLIVSSTLLSAVVQASSVLQVGLLGQAIGLEVPWAVYGIAAPMVALLTLLPVSLNGMGVREAGMVVFLAPANVLAGSAMTVAFLWFFVQTAAGLLGAGVYALGPRSMTGGRIAAEVENDDAVSPDPDKGRTGQRRSAA